MGQRGWHIIQRVKLVRVSEFDIAIERIVPLDHFAAIGCKPAKNRGHGAEGG